jgi:hypothetical protein
MECQPVAGQDNKGRVKHDNEPPICCSNQSGEQKGSPDGRKATRRQWDPMIDAGDGIQPGDDIFSHLDDIDHTVHYYGDYVDFNVPWNLNVRYNLNYSKPRDEGQINQTLNFSGDVSLTPRWKIQFSSGYDFRAKDFTMTSINILQRPALLGYAVWSCSFRIKEKLEFYYTGQVVTASGSKIPYAQEAGMITSSDKNR